MKKVIFTILFVFGFIFLFGSVGAADCETIGTKELLVRCSLGLLSFGGGFIGLSLY